MTHVNHPPVMGVRWRGVVAHVNHPPVMGVRLMEDGGEGGGLGIKWEMGDLE